ncbi:transposase [Verrucomicrobium sp. BvORR034]|uniref:transposase n=1 Tax=Verrucomicrobium sp. BvORR034 TaxID=1396418 RepID=UPI000678A1BE|nr:transposase [Verrucomicrobium sp. BvORR034]
MQSVKDCAMESINFTSETAATSLPWPHAPPHQLDTQSTFFVTGSTFEKAHHFHCSQRLTLLHDKLLQEAKSHGWQLEAWAVFPNHYHFVARPDIQSTSTSSLRDFINKLHTVTAIEVNRLDGSPARKIWHNYWDTRLTYHKAYIARLS